MQILINVPDGEFGVDIGNKFQNFFRKLRAETKAHMISDTNLVCGAYELETIDMFLEAFKNGTPLPKGHGRLIDETQIRIVELEDSIHFVQWTKDNEVDLWICAPTIIEADRSVE